MEKEFKKIANSNEYHTLHKFFDDSRCNSSKLLGPVCSLCKESNATTIEEWYNYYLFKTLYFTKIEVAAKRLHDYNQITKSFDYDTCYKVVLTLVLYQTWVGCKMEMEAKRLLENPKWDISFAGRDEDNEYAIDLIIKRNGKICYGVQVKPTSYYYSQIKKNKPLHQLNREKNTLFINKYHCRVKYLYYNENFEFDERAIEQTKNLIRGEVDRCETM